MAHDREPLEHVQRNRARWDVEAKDYAASGERAWARAEPAWGVWRVAESQLHVLPTDLAGKHAIELGCGTAYVSSWLARRGAHVVGIDASMSQLTTARRLQRQQQHRGLEPHRAGLGREPAEHRDRMGPDGRMRERVVTDRDPREAHARRGVDDLDRLVDDGGRRAVGRAPERREMEADAEWLGHGALYYSASPIAALTGSLERPTVTEPCHTRRSCSRAPAGVIHGFENVGLEPAYLQVMLGRARPDLMSYADPGLQAQRDAHLGRARV